MRIADVFLHPGKGQQDAMPPLFLIGQFTVEKLIIPVYAARLYQLLSREDAVNDMHILGR